MNTNDETVRQQIDIILTELRTTLLTRDTQIFMITQLTQRIEQERDPKRKYWLKQARMYLRLSVTAHRKGHAILRKLNTYGPSDDLKVGI